MKNIRIDVVKNKMKQHKKLFICCFVFIMLILVVLFMFLNNNKLRSVDEDTIYYRTYTEEEGWSKWVKNGKTSGDTKNNYAITKFQLKTDSENQKFHYENYTQKSDWVVDGFDEETIKAIKIKLLSTSVLSKKYDICYRTYNEENEWLDWSCNSEINGNKNIDISAIQIKLVPINGIKREYLENYQEMDRNNSIGF